MLGHSDLKTTQIYSKVVDRKVADDMEKLLNANKNSELGRAKNI
jgi:site-specific recombinase XerD